MRIARSQLCKSAHEKGKSWTTLIRICVLFFVAFAVIGCSEAQRETQPPATNELTDATPAPQASQSSFPLLNEQDLKRLEERFPKRQRQVLENAQRIDVYEIKPCLAMLREELLPVERGKFQGCPVLRHAAVTDSEPRKELTGGILYSIGSSHGMMACWSPRHGIRASSNGERVELIICFECENFRGEPHSHGVTFAGEYSETFGGGFSRASEELFERILAAKKSVGK